MKYKDFEISEEAFFLLVAVSIVLIAVTGVVLLNIFGSCS